MRIVRPIMLAADVPVEQAHPHALRHTFERLDLAAPKAELSRLQRIMGTLRRRRRVATSTTTITSSQPSIAGSSGCNVDPLARREECRRERAAGTAA
jgi:hypothetical protein